MTGNGTCASSSEGKRCFKDQKGDVAEPILRETRHITVGIMEAGGHQHGDNRWDRGEQRRMDREM